jgi:hypothetical protein
MNNNQPSIESPITLVQIEALGFQFWKDERDGRGLGCVYYINEYGHILSWGANPNYLKIQSLSPLIEVTALFQNIDHFAKVCASINIRGFDAIFATAITLPELEALAQKAALGEGLNTFETMIEESEAQKRYEAALEYLRNCETEEPTHPNDILQALRIAAGLE